MLLDLTKDNVIFIDETRVHIEWNVRTFYPQGEKNVRKVSSKKISLNCIGALAPRGNSHISFPKKTNAYTIVIFLLELLKKNTHNPELIKELNRILNLDNMDQNFVENEMKMELAYNEENFTKKIEAINQQNIPCASKKEKLEKLLRTFTISTNKLLYRLRANQMKNILSSNLLNKFNDIGIVWDNAPPHIAHHVKDILKLLGVKLVPLPVRCPEYNPIEYTWLHDKYQTAKEPIDDENELKKFFEKQFYELVEKNNYCGYLFDLIQDKRKYYAKEIEIPAI